MVHLNGSALPSFGISRDHLGLPPSAKLDPQTDQSYSNERASSPAQRSARSHHAARGPKPLLPRSLKEALQLAELLSKSKLIPKGFETPETCLVGILYGMEVGLSPIAALQRMAVIDGRPTIWGDAALALVQASGLLQSIHEEVIDQSAAIGRSASDAAYVSVASKTLDLKAICTVRREGRSEPVIGTFSIDDAKRAGLWQKPGPWTDYPKRMLIMRARAFALRDAFPDVLAGLYIREEFVGKERPASRSERDRSNEEAEWNAAAAHGAYETSGAVVKGVDVQIDEPHHVANDAKEGEQVITSCYDFTHEAHDQTSRVDRNLAQAITSGYGFTPETHGFSDPRDGHQSPLARRRAPPPPPEGEGDQVPVPVRIETDGAHEASSREGEGNLLVEGNTLSAIEQGERREPLGVDADSIHVFSPTDGRIYDDEADATRENIDPETLLDLLDSALCCALDLPTFHEIEDDFAERLKLLSKDHRKGAQKIIDRHHKRVEDLDRSSGAPNENQNGDELIPPALPRRLETVLSHLGVGRNQSRDRRSRRKERPSQSLSSWNARHRLAPHELSDITGTDDRDVIAPSEDQVEVGE